MSATSAFAHHCDPADPANAECHGNPTFLAPSGPVEPGFTGPFTVDFGAAPPDTYEFTVTQVDGAYIWNEHVAHDGEAREFSFTVSPMPAGKYEIELDGIEYGASAALTLVVSASAFSISGVSAAPTTFYPLVRDGYRDSTRAAYHLSQQARVIVRVFNSKAEKVLGVDLGLRAGSQSWVWTGKRSDGRYAAPGYYVIRFYATAGGVTKRAGVQVRVTTSTKTVDTSKVVNGYQVFGVERTTGCYGDRYYYLQTLDLNCWGGQYVLATYRFSVPSSAYNVRWAIAGHEGCCDSGEIRFGAVRSSSTSVRVRILVTGWRSYEVERVRIGYSYKVPI